MKYSMEEMAWIAKARGENDVVAIDAFIRNCTDQGITMITRESELYPQALLNLDNPPIVLFARGNLELLKRNAVAIVGKRECTNYGEEVAKMFAKEFAANGLVVVSGLAGGIDTAAHVGAGAANTIAVLGNGINIFYPRANEDLQREISKHGLVLSEYLPNYAGHKGSFPQRNRIVAALSKAVLIVEAEIRSGTMITRDWALELGVDVFCVPGPITSAASGGTNHIIKEGGLIATEPSDVMIKFGISRGKTKMGGRLPPVQQLSMEEQLVVDFLGKGEQHFDDLVEKLEMPPSNVNRLLVKMEIAGLVNGLAGNMYTLG